MKHFFRRFWRVLSGSVVDFINNNDYLKASALTFYTLISIVPFLAVAFGIATGFGFAEYLEKQLKETFQEQGEIVLYAIKFARATLENVRGSIIAGAGLLVLLWTNLSLLNSIESSLNDIWRVAHPRTWSKKFTDYLAAMIICPIFFVASSSLSVYLITQITETAKQNHILEIIGPYLLILLNFVPLALSILLFIVIYMFIPNTEIHAYPRVTAGIIAGVAFQLWQWLYIRFQVEISSYGIIYGTFAAFPLFLIWLQTSWIILLGGAEMAAHIENEISYSEENGKEAVHQVSMKTLGVLILGYYIQAYNRGERPLSVLRIAKILKIPLLFTQQILDLLVAADILVEIDRTNSYQPSRSSQLFTIRGVEQALEKQREQMISIGDSPILRRIEASLAEFSSLTENSEANLTMDKVVAGLE